MILTDLMNKLTCKKRPFGFTDRLFGLPKGGSFKTVIYLLQTSLCAWFMPTAYLEKSGKLYLSLLTNEKKTRLIKCDLFIQHVTTHTPTHTPWSLISESVNVIFGRYRR